MSNTITLSAETRCCGKCGCSEGMHAFWCPDRNLLAPVERHVDQPSPVPNSLPAVWPEVIRDMQARDAVGRERYGVPLQPWNGRNALLDAYEESLDKTAYLKSALIEREMLRRLLVESRAAVNRGDCVFADDLLVRALDLLPVGRKP